MNDTYLQQMGIERWCLREKKSSAISDVYSFYLGAAAAPSALLLFDAELKTAEEHSLVEAMVKAMRQPYHGGYQAEFSALAPVKVVVALGTRAANYLRALHHDVISSYAACELLREPKLKALAWKDLQLALGRLA